MRNKMVGQKRHKTLIMKRTHILLGALLISLGVVAVPPRIVTGSTLTPEDTTISSRRAMQVLPRKEVGTRTEIKRIPVIMVTFPNWTYGFSYSKAEVDSMFNAQHFDSERVTGSVRQYFSDQSNGKYQPKFDIYGPVTLGHEYKYYGEKTGGKNDKQPGVMAMEACQIMDDSLDFSLYDNDKDGNVDLVYIYYAGMGQEDEDFINKTIVPTPSDLIWPHYWNVESGGYSGNRKLDGKYIYYYECSNELDGLFTQNMDTTYMAGIGLACHEFCHALGLPDLYTSSNKHIVGMWDIMDYGCYNNDLLTPPCLSAYQRYFMGWLQPTLLYEPANCTLSPLFKSNEAYIITGNESLPKDPKTGTFYILENRGQEAWDMSTPDSGLLIWKIQTWSNGYVNIALNNTNNKMDILHADGSAGDGYGKEGDCYPYNTTTSVTPMTGMDLTNIQREANGDITFLFRGGATPTETIEADSKQPESRKMWADGQVVIIRNGKHYNLLGIQIN